MIRMFRHLFLMLPTGSLLLAADPAALRLGMVAYRDELADRTQWTEFATWLGTMADHRPEILARFGTAL